MTHNKFKWNIWYTAAVAILIFYLLFLIYPLTAIFQEAVYVRGELSFAHFTRFFSHSYFLGALSNSFQVSTMVTLYSVVLGTFLAYLFSIFQFKGKKYIQIVLIIASMSAPFIGAYSWILLLGRNGAVTNFLTNNFNFPTFDIYGFFGITFVMTLQLFPLIFLFVNGAFRNIDKSVLEASENLGCTGIKKFFQVLLPLLTPTILAGALLVFMRTFSDFGTPMLIGEGFRTFPVLIFNQFVGEVMVNQGFAAALSVIAVVIALTVFLLQKILAFKFAFTMSSLNPIQPKEVRGLGRVLIYIFVYGSAFIAILPQVYVAYTSFRNTRGMVFHPGYSFGSYIEAFNRMGNAITNTISISFQATVLIVIVSVFVSYLAVRRRNFFSSTIDTFSMIPFIVPGTVLGIALISAFNTGVFGTGWLRITGTALIMIVSLALRSLPYTIRSSVAALQQMSVSVEEAAESLGSGKLNTFFRITIPMMASGVISGAILSWITILGELSTSILLYNVRTRTMTVAIYVEVLRGNFGIAAALATILNVLTIVLLFAFMKVSKTKTVSI